MITVSTDHRASAARRRRRARGFTLLELMMAIVVGVIVLLGMFAFSSIQQGTANLHHRAVRISQALEGSMWTMGRDLRAAGFGFTRSCTELRIWSKDANRLLNPGAADDDGALGSTSTGAYVDPTTTEPYWVLRDGLQAHWRSSTNNLSTVNTSDISGGEATSAAPESAADSFDVIMGERNFVAGSGIFKTTAVPTSSGPNAVVSMQSNPAILDSTNTTHLSWVIQMMPPGSFFVLSRDNLKPASTYQTFEPQAQGQCALLQVTGPVTSGGSAADWQVPVSNVSEFNANLEVLVGPTSPPTYTGTDPVDGVDWLPGSEDAASGTRVVVPLGRLRWSRYEIDYTVPSRPFLVRTDLIGYTAATDPTSTGNTVTGVPGCTAGTNCPLAQLHIPDLGTAGQVANLPRIAVGPMIEDMQVAVGCDGWSATSAPVAASLVAAPDSGYEEMGAINSDTATSTPFALNSRVDELPNNLGRDEWLGNAVNETWGPDCVYYGTGEFRAAAWESTGPASEQRDGPGFRLSPQLIRVTVLGRGEKESSTSSLAEVANNVLYPIEDRQEIDSNSEAGEYYTVTETFAPANLRWRDPLM